MSKDLWYCWKAPLVPQGVPVPQFENSWLTKPIFSSYSGYTERMWMTTYDIKDEKETGRNMYFEVQPQHSTGRADENHAKLT